MSADSNWCCKFANKLCEGLEWKNPTMECRICISLNVSKTKELIVDFGKRQQWPYTPLMISGTPVERVSSFKYLGVNISEDLTWTAHIQTKVKKAVQRLYQLRKFRVSPAILKTFYSGAIESVPTQCTDTEMQISLLIIFCIIEYVTNKTLTPWILDVVNIVICVICTCFMCCNQLNVW